MSFKQQTAITGKQINSKTIKITLFKNSGYTEVGIKPMPNN